MSKHSIHRSGTIFDLHALLNTLVFLDSVHDSGQARRTHQRCLRILELKLLPEFQFERPLFVVVSGGTNVGKSSLVNWLCESQASPVSALARGTRSPVIVGSRKALDRFEQTGLIPGVTASRTGDTSEAISEPVRPSIILYDSDRFPPDPVLIVDSPDIDSDHAGNREWAYQLLEISDAIVFVVTPEKYNDAAVVRFLEAATRLNRTILAVFNKNEGNESFEDFRNTVLFSRSANPDCHAIPRSSPGHVQSSPAIGSIQARIRSWGEARDEIKQLSLDGSRENLHDLCHELARQLNTQADWIRDVRTEIDTVSERVLSEYILQLKQEKFTEFDRVFALMMKQFHIAVLDDVYSFVRTNLRRGYDLILKQVKSSEHGDRGDEIRARERHRAAGAFKEARSHMLYLPVHVPTPIRPLVENWISETDSDATPDMDQYERDVERISQTWVADESRSILETIGDRKGLRYMLTSIKAFFQLGSGVLSAFLTGGLSPIDAVVMPATERLIAFLIENGIGRPYFRQRQNQFYELRRELLRQHLDNLIFGPVRNRIPEITFEQSEQLRALASSIRQSGKSAS